VVIALFVPKTYQSTARLMPPDAQSISVDAMTGLFSQGAGGVGRSMMGGFLTSRTPGQTAIGILGSDTVQEDIVKRFDLKQVYRKKLDVDARAVLKERSSISEDTKSGIVSISVKDRDPQRARDLTQAYVENLRNLVNTLSNSSAHRERVFLEKRLVSLKSDLNASAKALSQFSSRTATIDPQKQAVAAVEATAKLQGDLINAESQLSELRAVYANDNVRVRGAMARVAVLQSQLRKLSGQSLSGATDSTLSDDTNDSALPSVRQLPLLGLTYADLQQRVSTEEALYAMLAKQYELTKIEEAKDTTEITVLDPPMVPEKKAPSYRLAIVVGGVFLSVLIAVAWVLLSEHWASIRRMLSEIDSKSREVQ
ncbi:MAG: lipopolysaccharide biosynthesis protein, partial [Bryocella sp.]